MKLIAALWSPETDALFTPDLRESLAAVGATRLQVNLDDEHIPESVLRLAAFDEPLTCVVSIWTDGSAAEALAVLRPLAARLAAWEVDERIPLAPPAPPDGQPLDGQPLDGQRTDGLAQVAFLRRPADLPYDEWQAHWQGPHTQVAMETQATFGYVQNRVTASLTDDTPPIAAVVEELFPSEAMQDIHAYYGSNGSDEELGRRMTVLMESVGKMGADHDLDVVATSRYVFDL